jgi:hypothetical protein
MQDALLDNLNNAQLESFRTILGAAPVLSTENESDYNQIWDNLIETFKPKDFLALLLIRHDPTTLL